MCEGRARFSRGRPKQADALGDWAYPRNDGRRKSGCSCHDDRKLQALRGGACESLVQCTVTRAPSPPPRCAAVAAPLTMENASYTWASLVVGLRPPTYSTDIAEAGCAQTTTSPPGVNPRLGSHCLDVARVRHLATCKTNKHRLLRDVMGRLASGWHHCHRQGQFRSLLRPLDLISLGQD